MKKPFQILIVICLSFFVLCPASAQTTFADANALYAEGEYAQAAEAYRALIAEYPAESNRETLALLQYNLGNACFKQGELAQSILAYERALRLKPNYKDAKYNLEFAQSKIIDNISDTQAFFLSNWAKAFRNLLAENTWLWLSVGLFVLFLAGTMVFLLGHETWLRKTAFHIGWLALLFSIWSGVNATSLHRRDAARAEAVITQGGDSDAGLVLAEVAPLVDRVYARTAPGKVESLTAAVTAAGGTTAFVPELEAYTGEVSGSCLID